MQELSALTKKRQLELVRINQILAILVVMLAFSTGYLLVLQEQLITTSPVSSRAETIKASSVQTNIPVPPAAAPGLAETSQNARIHRTLLKDPIALTDLQRLLWLAQGKITDWGERTVPSYKSQFPIDLYVYVRNVNILPAGMYYYNAKAAQLIPMAVTDSLNLPDQLPSLEVAPVLIIAINRNVQEPASHIESGGIAQQILLGATEIKLAASLIPHPDLSPTSLRTITNSDKEVEWIMPIGRPNPDIN